MSDNNSDDDNKLVSKMERVKENLLHSILDKSCCRMNIVVNEYTLHTHLCRLEC
jgi:hypothetical protein